MLQSQMEWQATIQAMFTSWPFWLTVGGIISLLIFRPNIGSLIAKITGISRAGITVAPHEQKTPPAAGDTRQAADDLLAHLDNQYVRAQEDTIKSELAARGLTENSAETVRVLIRYTAAGLVGADFERINGSIWGSQIQILTYLNSRNGAPQQDLLPFYQEAAALSPAIFAPYPFPQYMGFLVGEGLVEQQGNSFSITPKGRTLFLYLVQTGKPLQRGL